MPPDAGPRAGCYLHVPFCSRICPYCDFAVRTGDRARRARFVEHLLAEIELAHDERVAFDTIYFGGGTPSLLDPGEIGRLLSALGRAFSLTEDCRIFLEANPEDATRERLSAWADLGVATLSLGVQSLDPDALAFLGRAHGVDRAREAVRDARATGFGTVSVDLIYGLPEQTSQDLRRELDRVLELEPDHVSCYQLTIHVGTRFALLAGRGQLTELPADGQAELFRLVHETLNASGFEGYEVSQFARSPEHRSRHNMKYWDHSPYLGLGPSAHSYRDGRRWWNLRRVDDYQAAVAEGRRPIEGCESLAPPELALEALMTGLRTYAGVDLARIAERFGVALGERNAERLAGLERRGLVRLEGMRVVPTLDGLAVADALARDFVIPGADR